MSNFVSVGELEAVLSLIDGDARVYIRSENGDEFAVRSYSIRRYFDGAIELVLMKTNMCDLDI